MRISKTSHHSHERIHVFKDDNVLLTVAPWFGAKLTTLRLHAQGKYHHVLWPVSDEDLETNAWFKQSILFPYPNRLEDGRYTFEGQHYQWPINLPETNNQLHGMLFNAPFEVVESTAGDDEAVIVLVHHYDGSEPYYPFPFEFQVTYTLTNSTLTTTFQIRNTGATTLPFGLGWHPYFQIDGEGIADYTFRAEQLEAIPLSDRSLPLGKREPVKDPTFRLSEHVLDHAFQLKGQTRTYQLSTHKGLKLNFEVSEVLDYLQLFTPPGGETIAIEPMSCNVNAFNNQEGIRTLNADEHFSSEVKISLI